MRKKNKLTMVLAMILVLTVALFSGCSSSVKETELEEQVMIDTEGEKTSEEVQDTEDPVDEVKSTDPMDMILDGRYVYSFYAEGYGEYAYYFHFYEEAPVLGAVFYAGFSNNGITYTGTYTVEAIEREYMCYPDRENAVAETELITATAPYTVTFYDFSGQVIDQCAFDGDFLYNDMTVLSATGSSPLVYSHDTLIETSDYDQVYSAEVGVTYMDFVADEDVTSTLTLFHNMTYLDLVNMMVEGSWGMEENADGSYTYILKPFDESEASIELQISADGMNALYTQEDGDVVSMTSTSTADVALMYLLEGTQTIEQYETDAVIRVNLYEDGTCTTTIEIFENESEVDSGLWATDADGYSLLFAFKNAGELKSRPDSETYKPILDYAVTQASIGQIEAELTMADIEADLSETVEVLFSFTGGFTTLDCFTDNTYVFKYADYQIEEIGTWAFDGTSYTFMLTQSNGNEITASIEGDDHVLTLEYTAEASDQLKDTFTCTSDIWGPALAQ